MLKLLLRGAVATLGMLATSAAAEDWLYFGTAANGTTFHYDADSIRRSPEGTRSWVRVDLSYRTASHSETMLLWIVRCADRTQAITEIIDYAANGRVIRRTRLKPSEVMFSPPTPGPGSIGVALHEAVCGD